MCCHVSGCQLSMACVEGCGRDAAPFPWPRHGERVLDWLGPGLGARRASDLKKTRPFIRETNLRFGGMDMQSTSLGSISTIKIAQGKVLLGRRPL